MEEGADVSKAEHNASGDGLAGISTAEKTVGVTHHPAGSQQACDTASIPHKLHAALVALTTSTTTISALPSAKECQTDVCPGAHMVFATVMRNMTGNQSVQQEQPDQ